MTANWKNRTVWTGDNLAVMRGMNSESVDLIYLDPPFNSNQDYAAPIGSEAAGAAFKDTWTLSDVDEAWHGEIADRHPGLYAGIDAAGLSHGESMKAYLIMMAVRLLEMHRLLKPTGSVYLHCDPTASHYLKAVMDAVFGATQHRNEIIWKRTSAHSGAKRYGPIHDVILFYTRGSNYVWNATYQDYSTEYVENVYRYRDHRGRYRLSDLTGSGSRQGESGQPWRRIDPSPRHWAPARAFPGAEDMPTSTLQALDHLDEIGRIHWPDSGDMPRFKRYLHEMPGVKAQSVWTDVRPAGRGQRMGYPTQKPIALLERIVKASSNEGDMVLDPFCGCATTLVAADRLQRRWAGIDLSPLAVKLVRKRLRDAAPGGPLKGPASLLHDVHHREDVPVRTESWLQPRPSTHKHTLFGRQEGRCNGCLMAFPFRNMTIDHVVPQSKGGQDNFDNLQLLCGACNSTKGAGTQEELIAKLKREGLR